MRKREVRIQFRLSDKEATKFDDIVKKSGLTRSAFLRCLIRGLVPIELPPPDYFAFVREMHAIGNNLNQIAAKAHVLGVFDADRYDEVHREYLETMMTIMRAVLQHKEFDRWLPSECEE